jgi:hypothetical protein
MSAAGINDEFRAWAHERLDRLLENRSGVSVDDGEAEAYYRACMGFAHHLIGKDIIEAVAPTFEAGNSTSERIALAASIDLVASIWPSRSRSIGQFYRPTHWPNDLINALEMLNEGQVPSVFQRASGPGKATYGWRAKRFTALAALWAIHLEKSGQANSCFDANDRVAGAFGFPGGSGRRAATIARWRSNFEAGKAGIDMEVVRLGLQIASAPIGSIHDSEGLALALSSIAFGTRSDGARSLLEAGERYQAHKSLVDSLQSPKKRRGKRPSNQTLSPARD